MISKIFDIFGLMDKVIFEFKDGSIYTVFKEPSEDRINFHPINSNSIAKSIRVSARKFLVDYDNSSIESRIDFILKTYNKL